MFNNYEFINKLIAQGAESRMSDIQFLEAEIDKFLNSSERQMMIDGERYYNGDHDILKKKRTIYDAKRGIETELVNLPNSMIVDNQYRKMVNQKKNYLLGKPFVMTTSNETYSQYMQAIINKRFRRMLKNLAGDAINAGKAWLFVGYDQNGELVLRTFKGYEIKPFWADAEHTVLETAVRIYDVESYEGKKEVTIQKVEVFDADGIKFYERRDAKLNPCEPYVQPYITVSVDDQIDGYNWSRIPLICFKYNESEMPLIKAVKSLQDGINRIESSFEDNMEEDARNTILVIVNYDGQDLGEFRRNLAAYGAVKVKGDGDVRTLQVEVNAENYKSILKIFKDALIENAMSYDAKDDRLNGNPNRMNIKSMYSDIDLDADDMETEFQAALEELMWFVNCHLYNTGKGDWSEETVDFTFNRNIMINEAEIITDIKNSVGILSNRTLLREHPYVDDVDEELEQIEKEKQARMDSMGFRFGGGNE